MIAWWYIYCGDFFLLHVSWFVAPSESVGGGATVTTDADAPPGYSEVLKQQQPVVPVGIEINQPQLMYIQSAPQPRAFIQPVQYTVRDIP